MTEPSGGGVLGRGVSDDVRTVTGLTGGFLGRELAVLDSEARLTSTLATTLATAAPARGVGSGWGATGIEGLTSGSELEEVLVAVLGADFGSTIGLESSVTLPLSSPPKVPEIMGRTPLVCDDDAE